MNSTPAAPLLSVDVVQHVAVTLNAVDAQVARAPQ
jgi:hypothetical protein